jgi:hypothetical protein
MLKFPFYDVIWCLGHWISVRLTLAQILIGNTWHGDNFTSNLAERFTDENLDIETVTVHVYACLQRGSNVQT